MAQTYKSRFLAAMRELEREMVLLFTGLAAAAARELQRHADAEGNIPVSRTYDIQAAIGALVAGFFLGRTPAGGREPFLPLPDGEPFPLSPYSRALLNSISAVEALPIEQGQGILLSRLSGDPLVANQVRQTHALFTTNPLAQYERAHTWIDPNGYQLSERIWRTAGNTRRKLDLFLEQNIAEGRGALAMSRDLETFLQPGRTLRTKKPYGTDASYDAMRLARTETARAHARAHEFAAAENPFVAGLEIVLSRSHPKPDICDEAAAAGPWPVDQIPGQYRLPMHPHCLCTYRNVLVDNAADVIEHLRQRAIRA